MTIAEKITRAKADYDEVYEAGYEKGKAEGGGNYYDTIWDGLQRNGSKVDYSGAFGSVWNDDVFRPKYDIKPTNANTMFENSGIVDLKGDLEKAGVTLDFSTVSYGRFTQVFQQSKVERVGVIDTTGSATHTINYLFYNASNLREVEEWVMTDDGTQVFAATTTFTGCTALEEIRIRGTLGCSLSFQWCKKFSKASITSIFNALSTTTSGLSITLSKEAVNTAFGIDVDDATTYPEGSEYYTLRQSKSNWTVNYI